ncbi:MAG: BamA/TamA family outer membrane protein [Planctomycetota bacterium]
MISRTKQVQPPRLQAFATALAILVASTLTQAALAQGGARTPGAAGTAQTYQGGSLLGGEKNTRVTSGLSLSSTDETVTAIRVEGNRTVPASRVLAQMQTRVGRPFDPRLLSRDVKKLASLPWFVDVKPLSQRDGDGRVIILRVTERATIRYIEYLGNSKLGDKKLGKETGLKVGAAIDPYAVEDGRRRLQEVYKDNGYPRAQIEVLEGDQPQDKGVVYVINEGVQQKIWSVSFEGNTSDFASSRRLKTKIKSKPGVLYLFGGKLKREQLDADVNALTAYYRAFGFFQAKIGRILEFNDEGTWATIRFVIHEGPRYEVRTVRFLGNQVFASEDLGSGLKLPAGVPFEQAKLGADVEWLKEAYGSRGYVFADVRAEPIYLEEPGQLDVVYHIEEGQKWRVGRIFVHIDGENPHTRIQTALNRLSIRPGQVMDIRELRASERRLQASQLFLSEPARGITPKITYRIPELDDTEFTASGEAPQFRGQSPDSSPGKNAEPKPTLWRRVYEAFKPAVGGKASAQDGADVHIIVGSSATTTAYQMAPAPERHSVRKPPIEQSVYQQNLAWQRPAAATTVGRPVIRGPIIRGQSPVATQPYSGQPASGQPVATQPVAPTAGVTPSVYNQWQQPQPVAGGYGGATPRAVSPSAAPAGYNAPVAGAPAGAVQPTQFFDNPPAVPPPVGAPSSRVMGAPYVSPNIDTSITPIPPNPQLFPGGEFGLPGQGYPNSAVDLHVQLAEAQTGRFMIGAGVNSDAGVVGQILIDERNFDWRRVPTSWQDVYDGTAFRGGGQRFRIEAAPGTEVQRYLVSWQEPFLLDTPISLGLSGSYFDRRFTDWDEQRLGGRVSTGYQWTANDLSASLSYRYENVKIFDAAAGVPELAEVTGQDNQLHGFGLRIANDTRNNPFLATSGHFVELQLEQVVGTFDYPRAILDARKYFLVRERPDHSGRHVLVTASRLGFTGSNTPVYEHFFAGGFSTLRGFDFRGAGPVVPSGGRNVEVGGEFMFINTVEYMFPLTADDMVNGVVFCDFGTVEPSVKIDEFRVSPGVGLRLTIPAMGPAPIALDFAWPIARADTDDRQVFTFNVGFLR